MILDDVTTRILEQTCSFYELLEAKVYQIENLYLGRKRYKQTDALYFISPTDESLKRLINDFSKDDRIQYESVHLCFAGHISDDQLKRISMCKNLTKRLRNFQEINLQFYFFEDNIFTLNKPEAFYLFNTDLSDTKTTEYLNHLSYSLFTV